MTAAKVWRFVKTPLMLIILLAILASGAWWGYKGVTKAAETTPPPACVTMRLSQLTPQHVIVNVLNGGSHRGLAAAVAKELRAGGYNVQTVGNTTTKTTQTTIIGFERMSPEVQLVAGWFNNPVIQADGRSNHTVDVILGADDSPLRADPPTTLTIESNQVCVAQTTPATPSPTPTPGAVQTSPTSAVPTPTTGGTG